MRVASIVVAMSLVGLLSWLAIGFELKPSVLNIRSNYILPLEIEKYGNSDLNIDLQSISVRMNFSTGRLENTLEIGLPNLDPAVDRLMDPPHRRNLNRYIAYIRGDLTHATASESGDSVDVRVWLRLRNRVISDNFSKNFNFFVTTEPAVSGIRLVLKLAKKDGFSDNLETRIQEEIDAQDLTYNFPNELSDAGLLFKSMRFTGTSADGSFKVSVVLTAPLTSVPSLIHFATRNN